MLVKGKFLKYIKSQKIYYSDILDFSEILKKLEDNQYGNIDMLYNDIDLMIDRCQVQSENKFFATYTNEFAKKTRIKFIKKIYGYKAQYMLNTL